MLGSEFDSISFTKSKIPTRLFQVEQHPSFFALQLPQVHCTKLWFSLPSNRSSILYKMIIFSSRVLIILFACGVIAQVDSFTLIPKQTTQYRQDTSLSLFNFGSSSSSSGSAAKIPTSISDRDNQAINGIKAAIKKPRNIPLIECEFPPLGALNKLGDGSLRSALEAEEVSDGRWNEETKYMNYHDF